MEPCRSMFKGCVCTFRRKIADTRAIGNSKMWVWRPLRFAIPHEANVDMEFEKGARVYSSAECAEALGGELKGGDENSY